MVIQNSRIQFAFVFVLALFSHLAQAAEIEFFSPSGEVKKIRQVAVRFSEQMVAFGDPREVDPFDISCPAPGKGRWADQRNWIYDFEQDLPAGVVCNFAVKKGLAALGGSPIKAAKTYSFTTGGPAIMQSEPYEGSYQIDENQIFILGLDAPATADSIQKNAYCQAEGVSEQIPVRLILGKLRNSILEYRTSFMTRYYQAVFKRGENEGHSIIFGIEERGSEREKFLRLKDGLNSPIVVLQCQRTLPNNAKVSLVWGKGITSVSGIASSQSQSLSFNTRPLFEAKFSCERVNAEAGCIPVLPMNLSFSSPVSIDNAMKIKLVAESGAAVQAVISENDKKSGFVQQLQFPVPLPEKTKFKIRLPEMLTDDAGRTLSNLSSYPLEVRTDENPPLAKFASTFGILELNGSDHTPPLLPVTLRNVEPNLSGSLIAGQVLQGDARIGVLGWLKRLKNIDRSYNPETHEWDESRGPGKTSIFEKNETVKTFTLPKPLGDKAFEVVGIPLKEPGFYMVELASPRLGNALFGAGTSILEKAATLLGGTKPYYVHAAALVTNLSVHFKKGRESSLVWVTSLDQGKPVAGASVAVNDCKGKVYYQGKTDAQGLVQIARELPNANNLPSCIDEYDHQYFVTARLGNDFSFVLSDWNEGIALWRFNVNEGGWAGSEVAHAIMDRTLLRAGETVHMKLLARHLTGAGSGFSVPHKRLPASVTIMHQGAEDKFQIPLTWDNQGIAMLDWSIPEDAKQGVYVVQMPQEIGSFRVEAFRVPTMKAIVQATEKSLINVEQLGINIQVNYLSGGGASSLPVKLRGQMSPKFVSFPDYEDFVFANGSVKLGVQKNNREPWNSGEYELSDSDDEAPAGPPAAAPARVMLSTQELTLDAAGSGTTVFPKLPKYDVPQVVQAELEYADPNGEILTASTRIPLWSSNSLIGIKPDGWMASAEHLKFQAIVLDINGQPKPGEKVVVKALQREYFSHRRRLIGGFYSYDTHSEIKAAGELCQGVTDKRGLFICDVKAPASGNIILLAETKDASGNVSVANREIFVAGNNDWWFDASDNDRIDLLPEKKRYEPGDKARLQLRMPFKEAAVLVTVEREGILDSFVTHVTRANPNIEVPMKANYSPNVFVSALVIRGRVNDVQPTAMIDLGKPAFKMGLGEINVGWSAHELKVKVATDKQIYHVREQARVIVDVKRYDGSVPPKNSEITLVAVDEGLLELKPNDSWKLLEAMMRRRGIEVSTSTAQMQVIGKRHFGRKALAAGGGGGSGKSPREMFDTLLYWQARVKLDENGHAEASFPLNDSLTSFRIVAVANGDADLFGTGATSIQSTQDLMLLSGLPQLVREQDNFHAGFTVRNAGERPLEVLVTAKLSSGSSGKDSSELPAVALSLPAGESRNVGWDVSVPLDSTAMKWDVAVREAGASEDGDRLKVSQKVITAVPVRTYQATIMQLEKPESISVKLPEGAIQGRGGVKVIFRKQLGDGLAGVQEYMQRYPYTCLEQQASQAVALQDEARWKSLMKKLPSYLDRNGLLKYFPIMQQGDDTLTAYFLAIANEADYEIPEALLSRMRSGLTGFVEGRYIRYSALPTTDLSVRKLAAIEALARTGDVQGKWLDSITIEPNLWPTSAVIDWLSILQLRPGISRDSARLAEEAQQIIRSRLNFQGTTMGFSTERNDTLWWLMINGDVNANRVLLSLLDVPKWQADIPRLVTGTLGRQQRGHWSTTVSNAWGVLAMKKFSAKFESVPVSGTSTAELGKESFKAEWSGDDKSAQKLLNWPPAIAPLSLSHKGNGKPWTILQSLAALPLKQPLFTGYRVERQIVPVSQKVKGEWHKGDVVRIHLDVDAQSDMTWVVVHDPIPAGSSIMGSGLGGDSKLFTQTEKKQGWVWPAFEERTQDSFRAYYRFVPKGKFSVEYTVRLNNDGTFQLPTTRVEAMYAPEMFGELPNEKFVVMP